MTGPILGAGYLACEATKTESKARFHKLAATHPDLALNLEKILSLPVLYSYETGTALLTKWRERESARIECSEAIVTESGAWDDILERASYIQRSNQEQVCIRQGGRFVELAAHLILWEG